MFTVYIQERGAKRPRKVGEAEKITSTYEHEGRTYFWVTASLTDKTVTFSDEKPRKVSA